MLNNTTYNWTALIEQLEAEGYISGTDNRLVVWNLLLNSKSEEDIRSFKFKLVSLLATSESEQNRLYVLFDNWQNQHTDLSTKKNQLNKKNEELNETKDFEQENKSKLENKQQEEAEKPKATLEKPWVVQLENTDVNEYNSFNFSPKHRAIKWSEKIKQALKQVRVKQQEGNLQFDLKQTILQGILKPTNPVWVYSRQKHHASYFVLIEKKYKQSHQAHFIYRWVKLIAQYDVDVFIGFYQTDPRNVYSYHHQYLGELQNIIAKFPYADLLFFGNGNPFINVRKQKLKPWANILQTFRQRFLFQTDHPAVWGQREKILLTIFQAVIPVNPEGLQMPAYKQNLIDIASINQLRKIKSQNRNYLSDVNEPDSYEIESFKKWVDNYNISEDIKLWLAACAVYPEINWSLTLEIGNLINPNLVSDNKIFELLRFKWIKQAFLPFNARIVLIAAYLSFEKQMQIHALIVKYMKQSLKGSVALQSTALQIALHELLATDNKEKRFEIVNRFTKEQWKDVSDYVSLHQVNVQENIPINFRIPDEIIREIKNLVGFKTISKTEHTFTSYTETINGVSFDMVAIKGGSFTMGSPESEPERKSNEVQHEVTVSDFYMGKYAVTQAEYKAIMGSNPSDFKGDNLPVEQVSWYDAVEFCNKLSEKAGLPPYYNIDKSKEDQNNKNTSDKIKWTVSINNGANGYRLPTEAEWEFAARAGTNTPFAFGKNITTDQANYNGHYPYYDNRDGEYGEKTVPVNSFKPNKWGLYNMHGNVYEWCWDWFGYYDTDISNNPTGGILGFSRVIRGGSWVLNAEDCRSARRRNSKASDRYYSIGFRLSRNR